MNAFDVYRTSIPSLATSLEVVAEIPVEESGRLDFSIEREPKFLVVVTTLPNGARPPWLDLELDLQDPANNLRLEPADDERWFVDKSRSLIILNQPKAGNWRLNIHSTGRMPFAVNVMAFHPAESVARALSLGYPGSPPYCRACKITAKALALSIVAAATLPALPHALIAAVSSFLGVGTPITAMFIGSVIGDTADVIAEKLCKKIGLC